MREAGEAMTECDRSAAARALVDFISTELVGSQEDVDLGTDSDLLGSGLIDSLAVMRLVAFIEQSHGVSVQPADVTIENFMTVGKIMNYLESLGEGGGDGPRS